MFARFASQSVSGSQSSGLIKKPLTRVGFFDRKSTEKAGWSCAAVLLWIDAAVATGKDGQHTETRVDDGLSTSLPRTVNPSQSVFLIAFELKLQMNDRIICSGS